MISFVVPEWVLGLLVTFGGVGLGMISMCSAVNNWSYYRTIREVIKAAPVIIKIVLALALIVGGFFGGIEVLFHSETGRW